MTRRFLIGTCLAFGVAVISAQSASVRITGPRSVVLSAADLAAMPRVTVTAPAHDRTATYEGVSLRDLLTRVGVPAGEARRGRDLAAAVIVMGADGYRVAFGVAEFDPGFTDRVAILADKRNGAPLTADEGPFQLVLTGEKRPARWVRQVTSIDVQVVGR